MCYGKEIIGSSFTSQTSDKLPNPSRCERVNDAEPMAAMNDKGKLVTASRVAFWLIVGDFHRIKEKEH
jgi:hypothetical protein